MQIPGVHAVGEGRRDGRPCLVVVLDPAADATALPADIDGVPVTVQRGGPFAAGG